MRITQQVIFLLLVCPSIWGFSQTGVKVYYYNGTSQAFNVTTTGKLYFESDNLSIQMDEAATPTTIPVSIISKIIFEAGVIPVELVRFDGRVQPQNNQLNWVVVNEKRFKGYTVQRSANGKNDFKDVGFVAARNVTQEQIYTFEDDDKTILRSSTPQYYRLKMENLDEGNTTYSKTIALERASQKGNNWSFTISPNPTSTDLTVHFDALPDIATLTLQVVDITGRTFVSAQKSAETVLSSAVLVPTQSLSVGIYFLKIQGDDGSIKTEKFVKL
ncbi:MAG: T9SS type A sorting domain-containing protein [Saprospiraceae bacterium]|nr:T9SS type A sorting domain-containing protein [Saprospiraceae bacterium]